MPSLDRKWWTLIAVCTAVFMLLLDITVVNVALPSIQRSLHATFDDLQWVINAYALTLAAFMLTAGVLGDMFGRRGLFAIGLGAFSAASLLCGVSVDSLMLNLARAVQGVGGAIMFATSLALIADAFRGKERGTAFGIYGAVVGGAVAIGPLLGGAITSGIGWRWIFFVNVPIGITAVGVTLSKVGESKGPAGRRVDWFGFATFSVALFLLVLALVRGDTDGWGSPLIVGLLAGAGALLVACAVAELRGKDPMLDLSLFRRPAMTGVSVGAFAISASIFALFLYLTLYIQDDLGYSAFAAGIRFLPVSALSFAVAPVAGKLSVRLPARLIIGTGLVIVTVGCVLLSLTSATSGWAVLLPGFIVSGIGIGMTNPVVASSAVAVVPPTRAGMASGANNTFRQVGIATGIAALGTIFGSQMRQRIASSLVASPAGRAVVAHHGGSLRTSVASGQLQSLVARWPAAQANALLHAYHVAFSASLDRLSLVAAGIAVVGAVCSLLFIRQRDFVASSGQGHEGPRGPGGEGAGPGGDGAVSPPSGDGAGNIRTPAPAAAPPPG